MSALPPIATSIAFFGVPAEGQSGFLGIANRDLARFYQYPEAWPGVWPAAAAVFCSGYSFARPATRPTSGNTSCKRPITPCGESPSTSRHRFLFSPRRKAFGHPVHTMLEKCFPLLEVSYRLSQAQQVVRQDFVQLNWGYLFEDALFVIIFSHAADTSRV